MSVPKRDETSTAATAPMAANPTWPRESCPPSPVRKLIDIAMIANASTVEQMKADSLLAQIGIRIAATNATAAATQPRCLMSQMSRYSSGRRSAVETVVHGSVSSRGEENVRATPTKIRAKSSTSK